MKHLKLPSVKAHAFMLYLTTIFTAMVSFNSQAVSLSAYRIYLDKENRNDTFIIYNRDIDSQECKLSLAHNNFDDKGMMTKHLDQKLPDNSAKQWVRFSPKKFTLTPARAQTVRFTMRRKANKEPAEYRSYLVINCGAIQADKATATAKVTVQPKLVHNVPIIARTGKLEAKVSFSNFILNDKKLTFNVLRSGTRSVYGKIALFNKKTGKSLSSISGISIYPESSQTESHLNTQGVAVNDLLIRFTENTEFGGDLIVEQEINLKE
ncbi:MAG: hypothetical protein GY951_18510 [Psychromonas sp.]|nr:hypothetical protein [Alteromonadales bacterium]MCP5080024.1 hypothetical protein [Psychromonas sp.]